MNTITNETPRFLRDKDVAEVLSISRSHVWNLVKRGKLPAPIKLSEKITIWKSVDVLKVIESPELYFK